MRIAALEPGDYAYGNTRLRARRSTLLTRADYEGLLGLDVDRLLGALAGTPYRHDVEEALPRFHGARRVHEAVRSNLARTLRDVRGFYAGDAGELVELLLSWWDVRNVVTLLRGQSAGAPAEDVLPLIVAVGGLDEPSAQEVARQTEFAAAVQLLIAWRLPTREVADTLAAAWPAYERSSDLAALENAIVAAHGERVAAALERHGDAAEPLRGALRGEVDDRNLLIALRLRGADGGGGRTPEAAFPSEGAIARETLASAAAAPSRVDVAAEILALPAAARWSVPLARWVASGDVVALQDDLEVACVRARLGLFTTGDPLGIAVPLAFVAAKETEARNLRVVGEGAARGADADLVRTGLVLP